MDAHSIDRPLTLVGRPTGDSWQDDLAARARADGWVRTSFKVLLASYVGLAAVMIGLGLFITHFGPISRWDDSVVRWWVTKRSSGLTHLAHSLSTVSDTIGIVAVALVVLIVLALRRRWTDLLVLGIGLPLELAVLATTTFTVDRPRPDVPRLGSLPSTASFPSGHVAAAIVCYGGIVVLISHNRRGASPALRTAMWTFAGLLAIGIGWSRVYEGMHHPTDVMAGAIYGSCCLAVAVLITAICADVHERRDARHSQHKISTGDAQ